MEESEIMSIAEIYERELDLPALKPEHQYVLCPIGLVGAGKTTVVKPLSKKLSLLRISSDEVRKLLSERNNGYESVDQIVYMLVDKYLSLGYSICIDSDCIRREVREGLEKLAQKHDVKLAWIHINPPEEFILNKLSKLTPNWLGTAEEMIENYYRRKPLHENLNFPFVYTFDTSQENLPQQIEEAYSIITKITGN